MPRIIKDGAVVEDSWNGRLLDLESYNAIVSWGEAPAADVGVQLEPGEEPAGIEGNLDTIPLVAINFPLFTDGRGFSYARELRQRGYQGEIRAVGSFMKRKAAASAIAATDVAISSAAKLPRVSQSDAIQFFAATMAAAAMFPSKPNRLPADSELAAAIDDTG